MGMDPVAPRSSLDISGSRVLPDPQFPPLENGNNYTHVAGWPGRGNAVRTVKGAAHGDLSARYSDALLPHTHARSRAVQKQ